MNIDFSEDEQMSTMCNELTEMTQSKRVEIEHLNSADSRIAVEDSPKSPPLASVVVGE